MSVVFHCYIPGAQNGIRQLLNCCSVNVCQTDKEKDEKGYSRAHLKKDKRERERRGGVGGGGRVQLELGDLFLFFN